MATSRIKVNTEELDAMITSLMSVQNRYLDFMKKVNSGVGSVLNGMDPVLQRNISGKISSLLNKTSSYQEFLSAAIVALRACKQSYETVDSYLAREYSDWMPEEVKNYYSDPYVQYRNETERITKMVPVGEPQNETNWQCTYAATATMLRRKEAQLTGQDVTFSREYVYKNNPNMVWSTEYTGNDGTIYKTNSEDISNIENKTEYLTSMLDNHPEGIVIYCSYPSNNHAIVLTDYCVQDGRVQFFAEDNVNVKYDGIGRTELENTWLYGECNPIESCFRVEYVE